MEAEPLILALSIIEISIQWLQSEKNTTLFFQNSDNGERKLGKPTYFVLGLSTRDISLIYWGKISMSSYCSF